MNRMGAIGIAALVAAAGSAMAGDEVLKNGGFEGGFYENDDWGYIDIFVPPIWLQDEQIWENHQISKNAWITTEGNFYDYYFPGSSAYDGVNAIDVNEGIVYQELDEPLQAGAEYELSIALADNGLNDGSVIWTLGALDSVDDLDAITSFDEALDPANWTQAFTSDDPDAPEVVFGDWTVVSYTFVATGTETVIGIFGEDRIMADAMSLVPTGGMGCPADCNGDGVANILDFVCFQQEWQNQTAFGDCDGNGTYNILDFVCYQGVFAEGCP